MIFMSLRSLLIPFCLFLFIRYVDSKRMNRHELRARQHEAAQRFTIRDSPSKSRGVKNITFSNPRASGGFLIQVDCALWFWADMDTAFYVDGTTIPEVDFDVGPSWSGLLPISDDPEETRQVQYLRICPLCIHLMISLSSFFGFSLRVLKAVPKT